MIKKILLLLALPATLYHGQEIMELEKRAARSITLSAEAYYSDTTMDVSYYKLDLKIDHIKKSISGSADVMFRNLASNKDSFFLDLKNNMTADSITGGGVKLAFTREMDKILFRTHKALSQGEEYTVKIYYQGEPERDGFGSFVFSNWEGFPLIWSLSEPDGAYNWFPCKNSLSDKADSSEVWITCHSALTAVSNGRLISEIKNDDGTATFKWKGSYPIAHYLISVAIGRYEQYNLSYQYAEGKSMPVQNFYLADQFSESVKAGMEISLEGLKIFSELFGEYPFIKEKYGHTSIIGGSSMEHQTIATMGSFVRYIVIHELAHQWFGDKITCRDWHSIWLNEGFASYCEALFDEKYYGRDQFLNTVNAKYWRAANARGPLYVQDLSDPDEVFDYYRTYEKGAYVLHMLRGVVGDDIFFKIMKSYAQDPELSYSTAITEDFQKIAEREYGQSLDYFFKEWIYGENYPNYSVNWNYSQAGAFYNTVITLSQSANTNPVFFTMPVKILIHAESGDTTVTVFNNAQAQTFTVQTASAPVSLELDPDNWILKNVETIGIEDQVEIAKLFRLEQNYPNPFNPATKIVFSIPEGGQVKATIYDALGKEISVIKDEYYQAGEHEINFNAAGFSSGIYFYKLEWKDKIVSRKMTIVK